MMRVVEASAVRAAEGARTAAAAWARAATRAEKVEAGEAAEARAGEEAGHAEERALEKGVARRLRGMSRGCWEERNGRGEGRSVEGGREADREEGRQVRTRTDRRGGRKRKKGDG